MGRACSIGPPTAASVQTAEEDWGLTSLKNIPMSLGDERISTVLYSSYLLFMAKLEYRPKFFSSSGQWKGRIASLCRANDPLFARGLVDKFEEKPLASVQNLQPFKNVREYYI